jgi:hypothetical protein
MSQTGNRAGLRQPGAAMVDVVPVVSETVAGMLVGGGSGEPSAAADGGLPAKIAERVKEVFGAGDRRSADALARTRQGEQGAIAELGSALAWYARHDQTFAGELVTWADQAGSTGQVDQRAHTVQDANPAGAGQILTAVTVGVAANLVTGLVIALGLLLDQYYRISKEWVFVPWITVSDIPSPIRWAFAGPLWVEYALAIVLGGVIVWWQVRKVKPNLYWLGIAGGLIVSTVLALVGYASGVK